MTTFTRQRSAFVAATGVLALMVSLTGIDAEQGAPPASGAQTPGTGRGAIGPPLFVAVDADKDGTVTRAEMQAAFSGWFAAWDGRKTGVLTQAAIAAGLGGVLPVPASTAGRAEGRTPAETDVQEMLKVLPSAAPARPARPRRVLVLADSPGFTHSSIPLAARTIDELGRKTGGWSTTVSYDPDVITADNLKQYDAIVLNSTVGAFLDEAGDQAVTDARRAAFLAFVRGGKGLVGFHAASDAYHAGQANTPFTRAAPVPAQLAAAMVAQGDKDADQKLTAVEIRVLIDAWFDAIDTAKTDRISAAEFAERMTAIVPPGAGREGRGARAGGRAAGDAVGRAARRAAPPGPISTG